MNRLQNIKVLAVEDDDMFLEVLCEVFRSHGAEVYSAHNGEEALQIVQDSEIDVVVSDLRMPIMDGEELLRRIRKTHPQYPLVLFATGQSLLSEAEALSLGASGLLYKPVRTSDLLNKIEEILPTKAKTSQTTSS